jgi:hypothetical protein
MTLGCRYVGTSDKPGRIIEPEYLNLVATYGSHFIPIYTVINLMTGRHYGVCIIIGVSLWHVLGIKNLRSEGDACRKDA